MHGGFFPLHSREQTICAIIESSSQRGAAIDPCIGQCTVASPADVVVCQPPRLFSVEEAHGVLQCLHAVVDMEHASWTWNMLLGHGTCFLDMEHLDYYLVDRLGSEH